jgi:hypothetical protein
MDELKHGVRGLKEVRFWTMHQMEFLNTSNRYTVSPKHDVASSNYGFN